MQTSQNPETIDLQRSSLTIPLSNERFLEKAHLRGADLILLDLEDGVAYNRKSAARERLASAVPQVARGGARVAVRINSEIEMIGDDLRAAVVQGVCSIAIAKVQGPAHVQMVSQAIARLEEERGLPVGGIRVSASIETPQAFMQAHEIAKSDPRLRSIGLGKEDISAALGFKPGPDSLYYPMQVIMYAASAAGLGFGGYLGSIADYSDLDTLRSLIRRSKELGFKGGGAIHPAQVAVLNEEFGPSAEEVEDARAIVALAESEFAAGRGAFGYKGKMIDKPVVERHRKVLRLVEAIREREAVQAALLAAENQAVATA
jgi:citrate lyase subunit beta/citryl-CoA lyase